MSVVPYREDASFLSALADRIGTRLVLFVPNARRARNLRIARESAIEEITWLEDLGRNWLAGLPATTSDDTVPQLGAQVHAGDSTVAVAAVHHPPEGVVGALIAAKGQGNGWTTPELALVRFATDFYAPLLARCASRPHPGTSFPPSPDLDRSARDIASGMLSAANNGEMFLVYQPEVDLRSGRIVAVEALVRWRHPDRGELSPESFILLAEKSNLIKALGAWIVSESLREYSIWAAAVPELDVTLRVNVSPIQLADASLVPIIASALAEHGVHGDRMCVEITENSELADVSTVATALKKLAGLGITSALDDLASGFSSLGRLRWLRTDSVKIDRTLISGIDRDERAKTIVGALLRLADELGVVVIAEGVEDAAEAATLRQLGCSRAQGHYFGRPIDAGAMQQALAAQAVNAAAGPAWDANEI